MAFMTKTKAVAEKMVNDIKKMVYYTTIFVQCVFFIFYAYSIYNNINHIVFLVTYCLLFVLSLIAFINYLVTYKKSYKEVKTFKRILRVGKYAINGFMILVNIYEIIKYANVGLNLILLIVSIISLFAQIIIEIIRVFAERYVELFIISAKSDLQGVIKIANLKNTKPTVYDVVNAPLKAIVKKIEHRDEEEKVDELELEVNKLAEQRKIKDKQKKIENKITRKENKQKTKKEIAQNAVVIAKSLFKKKESNNKTTTE